MNVYYLHFKDSLCHCDEQIMTNKLSVLCCCASALLTVILQKEEGTGEHCQAAEPDKPINHPQDTAD